jgi:uncharacterized protein (DUF2062 family)
MPRRILKRYFPDHHKIREHHALQFFGRLLHDPNLWHMNRRSVAGAFAVGLFTAFIPLPFQMVLSAGAAIWARVNLPIAVSLVWLTNPFTMPPLFYMAYKVGAWVLRIPPEPVQFQLSAEWLMGEVAGIWKPLLVGNLVVGTAAAAGGYVLIRLLWRWHVVDRMRRKRLRRSERSG